MTGIRRAGKPAGTALSCMGVINTVLGAKIDWLCTRILNSVFPDFEESPTKTDLQNIATHEFGHTVGLADLYKILHGGNHVWVFFRRGFKKEEPGTAEYHGASVNLRRIIP